MKFNTLFHFENEKISLIEVKREDLPAEASKDEKYLWLKFDRANQNFSRLNFVSMNSENVNGNEISVREFEGAELRFDKEIAKFATMEEAHLLLNKSNEPVPQETSVHLQNYMNSI